jgi:hypothetical protein
MSCPSPKAFKTMKSHFFPLSVSEQSKFSEFGKLADHARRDYSKNNSLVKRKDENFNSVTIAATFSWQVIMELMMLDSRSSGKIFPLADPWIEPYKAGDIFPPFIRHRFIP